TALVSSVSDSKLESLKRLLAAGPPLRLAVLFGSGATGRLRGDSDLDIAVLPVEETLALSAELALQADLERAAGRPVDLVRLDRASTFVCWQVAKNGVVLLAQPEPEWNRFRVRAASDWYDFGPAMEEAARRYRA